MCTSTNFLEYEYFEYFAQLWFGLGFSIISLFKLVLSMKLERQIVTKSTWRDSMRKKEKYATLLFSSALIYLHTLPWHCYWLYIYEWKKDGNNNKNKPTFLFCSLSMYFFSVDLSCSSYSCIFIRSQKNKIIHRRTNDHVIDNFFFAERYW